MEVLTNKQRHQVSGGWLTPFAQGSALAITTFASLSHAETAYSKYKDWGSQLGERAFNSTHSDADILGQMAYTAADF